MPPAAPTSGTASARGSVEPSPLVPLVVVRRRGRRREKGRDALRYPLLARHVRGVPDCFISDNVDLFLRARAPGQLVLLQTMSRCLRIAARCSVLQVQEGAERRYSDETVEMIFGAWVRTRHAQLRKLCPGGGPQCLRDAFASHSGAVRVPVVVRSASGTHSHRTLCCSCPGGGAQCLWNAFATHSELVVVLEVVLAGVLLCGRRVRGCSSVHLSLLQNLALFPWKNCLVMFAENCGEVR